MQITVVKWVVLGISKSLVICTTTGNQAVRGTLGLSTWVPYCGKPVTSKF